MKAKFVFVFSVSRNNLSFPKYPFSRIRSCCTYTASFPPCETLPEKVSEEVRDKPKTPVEVFRKWGCSDKDILEMFSLGPSLHKARISYLQSKLNIVSKLGLKSSDLVKIIKCRPRFFSVRLDHCFNERLEFFMTWFGSRELLVKAITRNPFLLTYDLNKRVKPTVALYEKMGVSRKDLVPMLLSRPSLVCRTTVNDEKMECIRKTGVSKDSKMYKYVVTIIGVLRLETIHEKVANLEKFGVSDDEIFRIFGKAPFLLTLSVDKVHRTMTFFLDTMKLPGNVVVQHPVLLFKNLDTVLKPRLLLMRKIQEMSLGLDLQINQQLMMKALRMLEKRFIKVFVTCHPEDVANELLDYYRDVKGPKGLENFPKEKLHKKFHL